MPRMTTDEVRNFSTGSKGIRYWGCQCLRLTPIGQQGTFWNLVEGTPASHLVESVELYCLGKVNECHHGLYKEVMALASGASDEINHLTQLACFDLSFRLLVDSRHKRRRAINDAVNASQNCSQVAASVIWDMNAEFKQHQTASHEAADFHRQLALELFCPVNYSMDEGLALAAKAKPCKAQWLVMADWLDDNGQHVAAKWMRNKKTNVLPYGIAWDAAHIPCQT